jgi:hypothetical protein
VNASRQHLAAQIVAIEPLIGIGRILDPIELGSRNPCCKLGARALEERAREPPGGKGRKRRHRRKSRNSRAAQQLQQHGLELIVRMMRGQQNLPRGNSRASAA